MKPFYLTLPSGGEGNTTSSFTVNLPYEIDLPGQWEVALVDVLYPTSWYNVHDNNKGIKLCHHEAVDDTEIYDCKEEDYKEYFLIPDYYDKVDDILEQMNVFLRDFSPDAGKFIQRRGIVLFVSGTVHALVHEDVADMLGYDSPFFTKSIQANLYPSLIMQNLYVYTDDLIEPQIVGNVRTELLCIIPAKERTLKPAIYSPQHLHYLQVARNNFKTIRVDIRDVKGNPIPFSSGHSVVKLHFRPKIEE